MNNRIMLIGPSQSGKSTFLAVNYIQNMYDSDSDYLFERALESSETATLIYEWEKALNSLSFPEKTDPDKGDELKFEFSTKNSDKAFELRSDDYSGESYDVFNPLLKKKHSVDIGDQQLSKELLEAIGIIFTMDSTKRDSVESDTHYRHLLLSIKNILKERLDEVPIIVLFTKADNIANNIDEVDWVEFFARNFPTTYRIYDHFLSSHFDELVYACSIGTVKDDKIMKLNPQGFQEPLEELLRLSNILE